MKRYIPQGCSMKEIEQFQVKNKVQFPKAYIEFLYLAGKSHRLFDSGVESEFEMLEVIQDYFSIELQESNLAIDRPVWAIDMLNGEQFAFFYLDENSENPIVYQYINDWEKEPLSSNFSDIVFSTKHSINQYFESMVPKKFENIITEIIFGIVYIFTLRFLRKKT